MSLFNQFPQLENECLYVRIRYENMAVNIRESETHIFHLLTHIPY